MAIALQIDRDLVSIIFESEIVFQQQENKQLPMTRARDLLSDTCNRPSFLRKVGA